MDRTLDVAQSSMTNLHLPFSFLFQDLWRDSVTFVPGARDASHAPSFSSDKFGKIFRDKRTIINIFYNDPFSTCGYLNHFTQILDILNTFLPCTCNEK